MLPLCLFGCSRQIRDSQWCVLADGTYADAQRDRASHHTSAIDQQTDSCQSLAQSKNGNLTRA